MPAVEISDGDLRSKSSVNARRAEKVAWLIVVGLAIDLIIVITSDRPDWEKALQFLADLLIVGGVAGELIFARRAAEATNELQTRAENRLAEALSRAAKAEEELIKFRTPRSVIMAGKWIAFAAKLKSFEGTVFDCGQGSGGEIMHFWWNFAHALAHNPDSAGWKHINWVDHTGMYRMQHPLPLSGTSEGMNVEIHIHPVSRSQLEPAARALITALNDDGITAEDAGFNVHSQNVNAIHIVIGQKW